MLKNLFEHTHLIQKRLFTPKEAKIPSLLYVIAKKSEMYGNPIPQILLDVLNVVLSR